MSLDEERRYRTIRYVVMMSIRALLVIVCGFLVMADVPMLWLWLLVGVAGMAILPWLAVMLANDRLVRKPGTFTRHRRRAETLEPPPTHDRFGIADPGVARLTGSCARMRSELP